MRCQDLDSALKNRHSASRERAPRTSWPCRVWSSPSLARFGPDQENDKKYTDKQASDLITVKELEKGEKGGRLHVRDGDLVLLGRQGRVEHRVKHGGAD